MPQQCGAGTDLGPSKSLARTLRRAVRAAVESLESRTLMSGNWFVSTTGSDANPGTLAAPFRTIQHAANLAQPGDVVEIRGGVYRETVAMTHSGTASAPIVFQAYNNESVEIDGADPVSGWTAVGGGIYRAPQAWDMGAGATQVFVDGQAMVEARFPNTSLDLSHPTLAHVQRVVTSGTSTTVFDTNLTQPANFWNGAVIHFTPGQQWVADTATVTASGPGFVTFTYSSPSTYEQVITGNAYYLAGKFQALDAPGEFYTDPTTDQVYLRTPLSDSPASHMVEAKRRLYAFDLRGASYVTVRGLNIFAATVATNNLSNNIVLDHLNVQYLSQFTIVPNGWVPPTNAGIALMGNYDVLSNSSIAFSAGDGVYVGGNNAHVTNNIIHDVDTIATDSAPVRIFGGWTTVDHNTIYNAARSGVVHFGWAVKILNNVIHDVMLQTTDGGGTYTVRSDGTGSQIAYNRIYNIRTGGYGGVAIFLDDDSSNYTVDHNVTWNVTNALKLNFSSRGQKIYNNTFQADWYSIAKSYGTMDWTGTVLTNNIFCKTIQTGSNAVLQNNLTMGTDPRFVNPAAADYTLQATSPAINAGQVIAPYTNGYAGAMPDIGAAEYGRAPAAVGAAVTAIPTMPPMTPASNNPPPVPQPPPPGPAATSTIQAENYTAMQGISAKYAGIGNTDNGDWLEYAGLNFGTGVSAIQMNLAVLAQYAGQKIELRIDSLNGPLIGTITPQATAGWSDYTVQTTAVSRVTGVHNLYFVFVGTSGIANVDWFKFV